jgi:CheY-like chemotaxis protein
MSSSVRGSNKALRVLVADDMPLNLRAAASILKALGHGGVLVTDGQKALDAVARQAFDVLLLDVSMPVMGGLEVLGEIRAGERHGRAHVPVIIVSGHDLPEDREHYLKAGADGFLAKPLDRDQLAAELRRVLQGRP